MRTKGPPQSAANRINPRAGLQRGMPRKSLQCKALSWLSRGGCVAMREGIPGFLLGRRAAGRESTLWFEHIGKRPLVPVKGWICERRIVVAVSQWRNQGTILYTAPGFRDPKLAHGNSPAAYIRRKSRRSSGGDCCSPHPERPPCLAPNTASVRFASKAPRFSV